LKAKAKIEKNKRKIGMAFRKRFGGFERKMYKITCNKCGKPGEVPFKPREGTRVLCRNCFLEEKGIKPREQELKKEEKKKGVEQEAEEAEEEEEVEGEEVEGIEDEAEVEEEY
jgi:CxxC-x17-CxxC domain-containing protein